MHVLQLGPWPPPYGGVQTHIVALRRRMDDAGITNAVVNITSAPATDDAGVHYPRSAGALVSLLARTPADVLHLHLGGHLSGRVLALAAVCAMLPRRRSVLTFHSGGYPSSPAGRTARSASLRGAVMRRFDRIVVVNDELVQLFRRLGVEPERIRLIRPHAHPDAAAADARSLPSAIAAFAARHDPLFVSVGLLEPEYDLPLQVETLAELRGAHGSAGLVIVGSGSLEAALRDRIAASGVAEHILLAGDVAHADTLALIRRSDALLRTTRYDGDSISVREALALGAPVVATDTGMRPAGCHLFPVNDGRGLVRAVAQALAAGVPTVTAEADDLDAVIALYRELAA